MKANQSLELTAGRYDAPIYLMKQLSMLATLALAYALESTLKVVTSHGGQAEQPRCTGA
jgi:hypothetical protein